MLGKISLEASSAHDTDGGSVGVNDHPRADATVARARNSNHCHEDDALVSLGRIVKGSDYRGGSSHFKFNLPSAFIPYNRPVPHNFLPTTMPGVILSK